MPDNSSAEPRLRRQRSSVTADEILHAAEHVARDGFDAVTMRAVATHMGASAMALYRYFPTKGDLVDAMLDRVLGRIEFSAPTDDWRVDLTAFANAHQVVVAEHPWAIIPLFTHANPGLNATEIGETALQILARGGVTKTEAVAAFSGILALNYGWFAFSSARNATRAEGDPEAMLESALTALSPERFPLTVSVAETMSNYGSDSQYALALRQLIAGIAVSATTGAR